LKEFTVKNYAVAGPTAQSVTGGCFIGRCRLACDHET
jgi:hypothetical protein